MSQVWAVSNHSMRPPPEGRGDPWNSTCGILGKIMRLQPATVRQGLRHLRRSDAVMANLIRRVGPFRLQPQRNRFASLVRSIVSQQISAQAARSIRARLEAVIAPRRFSPETIAALSEPELRAAGLSPQKARYLHNLATMVLVGRVKLNTIGRLSDQEVIDELIQVSGIGVWTAQMFLIFSLGRPDVFPHQDLGVRSAIKRLYRLDALPDRDKSFAIAAPWRPYASIASWYCWRSHELPPQE